MVQSEPAECMTSGCYLKLSLYSPFQSSIIWLFCLLPTGDDSLREKVSFLYLKNYKYKV